MKQHVIELAAIWTPPTQQAIFRALLNAFSYPGVLHDLSGALAGSSAKLGVLATLLDGASTFCDHHHQLEDAEVSMLECVTVSASQATYLLCDGSRPPEQLAPQLGDIYRPEQGATIVLNGQRVGAGDLRLRVSGPGVASLRELPLTGFDPTWFARRRAWVANFPTGVDLLLCDGAYVTALPRTTKVELLER